MSVLTTDSMTVERRERTTEVMMASKKAERMASKKDDWKVWKMVESKAGKMVAVLVGKMVEKMVVPMVDWKDWDLVPMMTHR